MTLWVLNSSKMLRKNIMWCGNGIGKVWKGMEAGLLTSNYGKNNRRSRHRTQRGHSNIIC